MIQTYDKIRQWIEAIAPEGVTVIYRNPNAPMPPKPCVTMRITDNEEQAHWRQHGVNCDGEEQAIRWHAFTLGLQVFGRVDHAFEAETIAQHMLDEAYFSERRVDFLGRQIAFNRVSLAPSTVDEIVGTQWEPRVVMDWTMSAVREITYEPGSIEAVEWSGNDGDIGTTVDARDYQPQE